MVFGFKATEVIDTKTISKSSKFKFSETVYEAFNVTLLNMKKPTLIGLSMRKIYVILWSFQTL